MDELGPCVWLGVGSGLGLSDLGYEQSDRWCAPLIKGKWPFHT